RCRAVVEYEIRCADLGRAAPVRHQHYSPTIWRDDQNIDIVGREVTEIVERYGRMRDRTRQAADSNLGRIWIGYAGTLDVDGAGSCPDEDIPATRNISDV